MDLDTHTWDFKDYMVVSKWWKKMPQKVCFLKQDHCVNE